MNHLQKEIVDRIKKSGPLPFAAFMQLALYDPRYGYYAGGAQRTGWRGHFLTFPELDPSFGALWARGFREVWIEAGAPESFEVVEIGPGEGGFARAVLDTIDDEFRTALTYRLVERVPAARDRQRALLEDARVEWTESITELPEIPAGCIFANEILDNLPVHVVEMSGKGVMEVCVGEERAELTFILRPPSNPELVDFLERTGMTLREGERVEVSLAAESLVAHVTKRLDIGAVFFVDYGMTAEALMARGGTLVAYSATGADSEVLERPGEKDITAHANWTSVMDALRRAHLPVTHPIAQRDILLALGAKDLERSFRTAFDTATSEGRGADAVAALSRRQALGALLDPAGLGGLEVVAGTKGITTPAFLR